MRFLFVSVVWGREYIDEFVNFSLPSQMSPNNLGDNIFSNSKYLILTETQHINQLTNSSSIKKLEEFLSVEFSEIPDTTVVDKYQKASLAKATALQLAKDVDGVFLPLSSLYIGLHG